MQHMVTSEFIRISSILLVTDDCGIYVYQELGHLASSDTVHRDELVPFHSFDHLDVFGAIYYTRSSFFFTSYYY